MKKVFVLLCLISCNKMSAQTDFRSGYIINGNDTAYGLIDYRGGILNQEKCVFRKDSISAVLTYLPNQLTSYRFINNKFYVSKTIKTDEGEKLIFLECLIKGKVTVYYAWISGKEVYFVEKDTSLREMNNDEKMTEDEYGTKYISRSNQYKGMLRAYFSDCPEVFRKVDQLELDKKSLIKISKDYHEHVCKDEKCIIYEKSMANEHLYYCIDFTYDIIPGNLSDDRYVSMIGLGLQRNLPQFNENDYCEANFKLGLLNNTISFLYLNILYMHKYVSKKIHPFIAGGGSFINFLPFLSCQTGIDIPISKQFFSLAINYDGWFSKNYSIFGLSTNIYF